MKNIFLFLCCLLLTFSSCIKDEIESNNEAIFQAIWEEFDARYGGFGVRGVDWDSVYNVYAPMVNNSQTEYELFLVCSEMLEIFDDQHIFMQTPLRNGAAYGFSSGKANDEVLAEKEFRLVNVLNNYLEEGYILDDFGDDEDPEIQFAYGKIKNENIGYVYLPHFEDSSNNWHEQIDDAIAELQDTDGVIIDVRNNGGGFPIVNRYVARRFMADNKFIFSVQTRNGPEHTDFDEATNYYSTPEGDTYTKPIVALINKSTVSAGEEFMLFMESQDHVTVMGTPTSNAFATESFERFLPNGWRFGLPIQLYKYPDGSSPEGVGIIPDFTIQNDTLDVDQGIDELLEAAIMEL